MPCRIAQTREKRMGGEGMGRGEREEKEGGGRKEREREKMPLDHRKCSMMVTVLLRHPSLYVLLFFSLGCPLGHFLPLFMCPGQSSFSPDHTHSQEHQLY